MGMDMNDRKKMDIEITDKDFLKKTHKEQNLILFKKLCGIDESGCSWGNKNISKRNKKLFGIGALTGGGGGFLAIITKWILTK